MRSSEPNLSKTIFSDIIINKAAEIFFEQYCFTPKYNPKYSSIFSYTQEEVAQINQKVKENKANIIKDFAEIFKKMAQWAEQQNENVFRIYADYGIAPGTPLSDKMKEYKFSTMDFYTLVISPNQIKELVGKYGSREKILFNLPDLSNAQTMPSKPVTP